MPRQQAALLMPLRRRAPPPPLLLHYLYFTLFTPLPMPDIFICQLSPAAAMMLMIR